MLTDEYDYNLDMQVKQEEAALQKAIEAAKSFYANGASIELIATSLKMTINEIKEIVKDTVPEKTM